MSQSNFQRCLTDLQINITHAGECLSAWQIVAGVKLRDWKPSGFEKLPAFQSVINRTSFLGMVIQLYKVMDTNPQANTLKKLVKLAKHEGLITDVIPWNARIDAMKPLWEKIKALRHQFYAHSDSTTTVVQLLVDTGLTELDMEQLLGEYVSFVSAVYSLVHRKGWRIAEQRELLRKEMVHLMDVMIAASTESK